MWIRWDREVRGIFPLVREVLQNSGKEMWSNLWGFISATLYIPFENPQIMYLCWLKMESQMHIDFYGSLETYSHSSKQKAWLPCLFTGQFLASISKHIQLFTVSWVSSLGPPRALVLGQHCPLHTNVWLLLRDVCYISMTILGKQFTLSSLSHLLAHSKSHLLSLIPQFNGLAVHANSMMRLITLKFIIVFPKEAGFLF